MLRSKQKHTAKHTIFKYWFMILITMFMFWYLLQLCCSLPQLFLQFLKVMSSANFSNRTNGSLGQNLISLLLLQIPFTHNDSSAACSWDFTPNGNMSPILHTKMSVSLSLTMWSTNSRGVPERWTITEFHSTTQPPSSHSLTLFPRSFQAFGFILILPKFFFFFANSPVFGPYPCAASIH